MRLWPGVSGSLRQPGPGQSWGQSEPYFIRNLWWALESQAPRERMSASAVIPSAQNKAAKSVNEPTGGECRAALSRARIAPEPAGWTDVSSQTHPHSSATVLGTIVGRQGLEPRTYGLRVRCSAS